MKAVTTKKFYDSLKQKMPKIGFRYSRKTNNRKACVHGSILNSRTNIGFDVYVSMSEKNTFRARYYFGRMKFNEKTLFYVNGFNDYSPYDYKAILSARDNDYINGDLEIVGSFRALSVEEASERFIKMTEYLFNQNMKSRFVPLIKLVRNQDYKPIEEMN